MEAKTQSCMKSRGFNYAPTAYAPHDASDFGTIAQFWKYRTTSGYGAMSTVTYDDTHKLIPSKTNFLYVDKLSGARRRQYFDALLGSNPKGVIFPSIPLTLPSAHAHDCESDARREVLAPLPFFNPATTKEVSRLYGTQNSSDEIARAQTSWAACMSSYGIKESDYDQSQTRFEDIAATASLSTARGLEKKEVATATSDARCFLQTIYPSVVEVDRTLLRGFSKQFPAYQKSTSLTLRLLQRAHIG
jgi:hypothetical protein